MSSVRPKIEFTRVLYARKKVNESAQARGENAADNGKIIFLSLFVFLDKIRIRY